MEVTKIILAKVSRFCQLSSHKHGFLSDLRFFKFIGLAYGFLSVSGEGWGELRLLGQRAFSTSIILKAGHYSIHTSMEISSWLKL
jgi:hypothetical protein